MMHVFKFLWVVLKHKYFVYKAGRLCGVPLLQLVVHDWSKLSPAEFLPYARHFYKVSRGPKKDEEWKIQFDRAWLHHIHMNPHHWEHWLLPKRGGGFEPLQMPTRYVREMLADWMAASRAYSNAWPPDIAGWTWWQENMKSIVLHPSTAAELELLMGDVLERKRPYSK